MRVGACTANLQPGLCAELQLCGLRFLRLQQLSAVGQLCTRSCEARRLLGSLQKTRNLPLETMSQKVVLITGCSSGIGLALAARIAKDEKKRFMGKVPGWGKV